MKPYQQIASALCCFDFNGNTLDRFGIASAIFRNGSQAAWRQGPYGGATQAVRSTGYLDLTGIPAIGTSDFTIQTWVFCPSLPTSGYFSSVPSYPSSTGLAFMNDPLVYGLGAEFYPSANVAANVWTFIAIERSYKTISVYVGNTKRGQSSPTSVASFTSMNMLLGNRYAWGGPDYPMLSYYSDFRVYKEARFQGATTIALPTGYLT